MTAPRITSLGQGKDLALIHGWGLGSAAWKPVFDKLAQRCRVHLVDLPGYEKPCCPETGSQQPATEAQTEVSEIAFADCARQLVAALPAGVTLCGWSLGGMLAWQAALLAPERIGALVLVGATPSFTQRADWLHAQPPELLGTFKASLAENPKTTLQRFISLLNQGEANARALGRMLLADLTESGLPSTGALEQGLAFLQDIDLRGQVSSMQAPTLLIHGAHDPLMPLAAARWLSNRLAQSRLEIFADAAHAPFLNDPQRFATLVGDFCHAATTR
jgi:pimeloyl-[acyl-carrier protein] methyl ester esterase